MCCWRILSLGFSGSSTLWPRQILPSWWTSSTEWSLRGWVLLQWVNNLAKSCEWNWWRYLSEGSLLSRGGKLSNTLWAGRIQWQVWYTFVSCLQLFVTSYPTPCEPGEYSDRFDTLYAMLAVICNHLYYTASYKVSFVMILIYHHSNKWANCVTCEKSVKV